MFGRSSSLCSSTVLLISFLLPSYVSATGREHIGQVHKLLQRLVHDRAPRLKPWRELALPKVRDGRYSTGAPMEWNYQNGQQELKHPHDVVAERIDILQGFGGRHQRYSCTIPGAKGQQVAIETERASSIKEAGKLVETVTMRHSFDLDLRDFTTVEIVATAGEKKPEYRIATLGASRLVTRQEALAEIGKRTEARGAFRALPPEQAPDAHGIFSELLRDLPGATRAALEPLDYALNQYVDALSK